MWLKVKFLLSGASEFSLLSIFSIQKLEERFRLSRRELIAFEFTILVALEMALYLPDSKVMPHYRRLTQSPG